MGPVSDLVLAFFLGAIAVAAIPSDAASPVSAEVRETAVELRERALAGSRASEWVRGLTDRAGPRLAGSPGDREAVAWGLETLRKLGFSNVRAEKVTVRVWQRGLETGEVVAPYPQKLVLTALGGSVPTPEGGLESEIVELPSLEALAADPGRVRGKIVFFNKRMERTSDGSGYSRAVDVRSRGAQLAGRHGALGVLIRSIGTDRNRTPHTGGMEREPEPARIPAAAVSAPDADLLERLGRAGKPVRVRFTLTCGMRPDAESANVIGEIPGREKPEEIVLLGAHLDSWDLGTGAIDDAAGCGVVIEAARLIGGVSRRPQRTIRVVLFANEENGLAGGRGYAAAHEAELPRHAAAFEADSGTGRPIGLSWNAGPSAEPILQAVAPLLETLGAGRLIPDGSGGADISPLRRAGVPVFAVEQDASTYFDYHHSADDTFDKIEPQELDRVVGAVALLAYVAASTPEPFEKIPADRRSTPE